MSASLRRRLIDLPEWLAAELGARTTDDVRGTALEVANKILSACKRRGITGPAPTPSAQIVVFYSLEHPEERTLENAAVAACLARGESTLVMRLGLGPAPAPPDAPGMWVGVLWDGKVRPDITRRRRRRSVEITFDDDVLDWLERQTAHGLTMSHVVSNAVKLQMKRGVN